MYLLHNLKGPISHYLFLVEEARRVEGGGGLRGVQVGGAARFLLVAAERVQAYYLREIDETLVECRPVTQLISIEVLE